jgi:hypothetical protein
MCDVKGLGTSEFPEAVHVLRRNVPTYHCRSGGSPLSYTTSLIVNACVDVELCELP